MMMSCDVIDHNFGEEAILICVNASILHNIQTKVEVESSVAVTGTNNN